MPGVLTVLVVYAAGFAVTGVAVTLLARRHGSTGPQHTLVYAALWPLVCVALLVAALVFAPVEIAARLRRPGG